MPNFIDDYLAYNEGNECPKIYHQWAAFSLLAVALGRKVFIRLGGDESYEELKIVPELYICLVGLQGSRKTFAKDVALNIVLKHLDIPMTASVETARSLTQFMASDDGSRVYTDHNGKVVEYRPMYLSIDELKNFLSVDPIKLVDLFVGIYGRPSYIYRTAHKGTDVIQNPCMNVLACATTEFIVDQLRDKILSGGLARRMLFVNVGVPVIRNGDPKIPEGGRERLERAIKHLVHISLNFAGEFQWATQADFNRYMLWYESVKLPDDGLMHGFYNSKHIQAYKLAMSLAAADYEPKLFITFDNFSTALKHIDELEPGMQQLFAGAGRNELAGPMLKMLTVIQNSEFKIASTTFKGIIAKRKLFLVTEKDLNSMEQQNLLSHLKVTEQVVGVTLKIENVDREFVMTKEAKQLLMASGLLAPPA